MLRYLRQLFAHCTPEHKERDAKKRQVQQLISRLGVNWCDVENTFFWKEPCISLGIYCLFTGALWKFICVTNQKLALFLFIASSPCMIHEVRKTCLSCLHGKFKLSEENKKLPVTYDEVCDFLADSWIAIEHHALYMMHLREVELQKFCIYISSYISILVVLFTYMRVADILFIAGTIVYFYPILNYLRLHELVAGKLTHLTAPFHMQLVHSQTKRKRNMKRQPNKLVKEPSTDTDDEFIPDKESWLKAAETLHNTSMSSSMDEFDLQYQNHLQQEEGHSSDYDEETFLPSTAAMPSVSQMDSLLMEPSEAEFHAGLKFNSNALNHMHDTDDDLLDDDLPYDHTDATHNKKIEEDDNKEEYEFLDRQELHDVTDEEIKEISAPQESQSRQNSGGVSSMLGY